MPATNWPSAASFSDCVSRLPQLLALGLELGLRRQVARDDDAADALAFGVEQVGHGDHERPVQHRIDDLARGRRAAVGRGRCRRRARRATPPARGRCTRRAAGRAAARACGPAARRERVVGVDDPARADRTPTTRCAIESNVFSSSRCDRMTSSSSCRFSIALDSWRPSSSARSSRSSSPPVSTRTPSNTIVPSARRQPRSGTVTVDVRGSRQSESPARISGARAPHRDRRRRQRIVGGDLRRRATHVLGIGRRLQHELTRAAIVNPDRRAIGAEQPVGAVAEDVEPGGEVQRRREALRELVEQQRAGRAAARRAGGGGTARAPSGTRRPSARRRCRATAGAGAARSRSRAARCARRRARAAAAAPRGVPDGTRGPASRGPRRRRAAARRGAKASATSAASSGAGVHGSVGQLVEAEAGGGLHRAVARVVLEEQRAGCRR